ncbi:hypothetical protein K470DRAFT_98806 [Piedraia hortae CBS 480.64]|uniref:Uncharacterized protein n=1 Tax=Piedraia hortae CBS 480.64 TaxID=1314780 RepID=A0A6A7BWM7_9PEZI|nr:hypothetical protein K470DRAFT_98806 [Piedraia hortae CBS 480.64]
MSFLKLVEFTSSMLRSSCVCAGRPAPPKRTGNLIHRRALLVIHSYARYHARMNGASGLVYSFPVDSSLDCPRCWDLLNLFL